MQNENDQLGTIKGIWKPDYQRELTLEDSRNIRDNLTIFFRLFKRLHEEERSIRSKNPMKGGNSDE